LFSACTDALFVLEGDSDRNHIYSSINALAAAHRRQRALNLKCKHLQEAGVGEAELCNVRKRAAMVNQIQGGFSTSDDWPDWLRLTSGIVPRSTGGFSRPPNRDEMPVPPCITDCALGVYDVESEGKGEDSEPEVTEADAEEHSTKSPYGAKLLLRGMPPQLKKCSSTKLREFKTAAEEYFNGVSAAVAPREAAHEILQQLLGPDLAQLGGLPGNVSPIIPMSRVYVHCNNLLGCRMLDAASSSGSQGDAVEGASDDVRE